MTTFLTERAAGLGIDAGFYDINGMYHVTKPEVMEAIVHTLQQNHVSDGLFQTASMTTRLRCTNFGRSG